MAFASNPLSLSVSEPAFEAWLRDTGYLEILDDRAASADHSPSSSSSSSVPTPPSALGPPLLQPGAVVSPPAPSPLCAPLPPSSPSTLSRSSRPRTSPAGPLVDSRVHRRRRLLLLARRIRPGPDEGARKRSPLRPELCAAVGYCLRLHLVQDAGFASWTDCVLGSLGICEVL
ncbi:unnamed protein product [Musa textilis]